MLQQFLLVLSLYMTVGLFDNVIGQTDPLSLISNKKSVELPFQIVNGLIVVEVELNHSYKANLVLDTGAENLVLFDSKQAKDLGLKMGKRIELKGSDLDTTLFALICRSVPIKVGDADAILKDFIVLDDHDLNIENSLGMKVDGLLGGRAFWGLVLEFNFNKGLITFYKKMHFDPKLVESHLVQPIEVIDHKPYIKGTVSLESQIHLPLKLLLDTGSSLGILLFVNSHPSLILPKKYIKGPLGRGIGGLIYGYLGRLKNFRINQIHHFPLAFSYFQEVILNTEEQEILNGRHGLIGSPILSKFHFFIDYVDKKIHLKASKDYNKQSDRDKSGLILNATGADLTDFVVKYVLNDSPADKAGIQKGDVIKKIGWWPSRYYTLDALSRKLSRKEGTTIKLSIERNGVIFKRRIKLKDYLKALSTF